MNSKALTLIVAGLIALPMAAAASTIENQGVVTGHTTYANMGGFDPNIAALAGLAESKVVWFNGKTIFSSLGEGFVYAVDSEVPCSPINGVEYRFESYNLSFIDPNNQSHIVGHYTFQCDHTLGDGLDFVTNELLGPARHHVWVTTTHSKLLDGPLIIQGNTGCGTECDQGRWYNFALAVDTQYMDSRSAEEDVLHNGQGGRNTNEINEGDSYCEQDGAMGDHVCNEGSVEGEDSEHTHNSAQVDLYFSREDRGSGATTSANTTHLGTAQGCDFDAYCSSVKYGTYQDPTSSTA